MPTYDRLRDLPLVIESCELEGLETRVSSGFDRRTTVVSLRGAGHAGVGEDVTYDIGLQHAFLEGGTPPSLTGRHTLDSFSALVGAIDAPGPSGAQEEGGAYRRWAFESAALDLALRQAGKSLAEVLDRQPGPVMFVVSLRLGEPPDVEPLERLVRRFPWMRFKLDATSGWTEEVVASITAVARVEVVDLKAAYTGTEVDQPPDVELYRRVVERFPHAWLEDPGFDDGTREVLQPAMDRVTWDASLRSVQDIRELSHKPRMINVKPSRFGSVRALCDVYDHCDREGIRVYGGGQFELGPGRRQIQHLAALFHPDGPNDVAPVGFNEPRPPVGLQKSPLPPPDATPGFGPAMNGR